MTTCRIHSFPRVIIIFCLKILTSSLAGERPPISPAYFNPSVHPIVHARFLTAVNIWSAFFPPLKPLKEANVNWNHLSLWDISSLRTLRWKTGTPVGPPRWVLLLLRIAHRWVGWDMKGAGVFQLLQESHEDFRDFITGTDQRLSPMDSFRLRPHNWPAIYQFALIVFGYCTFIAYRYMR